MLVLGIDYGTKYFGLAFADTQNEVALPLKELSVKNKTQAAAELRQLIKERKIEKLVFGLPLNFHFEETPLCAEIREFAEALAEETGAQLSYQNEVLTTDLAKELSGTKHKDNSLAAKIILEDYLVKHKEYLERR